MKHNEVILKPIVTEKSTSMREKYNKYTFIVHKDSNKIMIEDAIKKMFQVEPIGVNIVNVAGKRKKVKYKFGFTSSYKKAIIALKKGDKISIFEGA
jgi:large subunit ribosomal protein L23